MILSLINKLIALHAGISWDTNVLKPLVQTADDIRQKLKSIQGGLVKSEVIAIDNHGNGFHAAVEETQRMAEAGGLSREDSLRLTLFTEEILSMTNIVTGEVKADFWIERVNRQYELHISAQTDMDRKTRAKMKKAVAAELGGKSGGFLSKLRGAFERAMVSDSDRVCFALPSGEDRKSQNEWDGFERSILFKLADDVRIAIIGGEVRMVVRKEFPAGE